MRRLLAYSAFTLISLCLLTSCGGGGDDDGGGGGTTNDYIRIDNNVSSITIGATEQQKKISVYANCSWSITISADNWNTLKLDKSSGKGDVEVWIETDPNTTTQTRTATLTFKSPGITKMLTVTQGAASLSFTVSPNEYDFPANGDKYTFTVDGNTAWKVTTKPEWCELDKTQGNGGREYLTVTVGENPNTTARNGQILLTGEVTASINVSQQGKAYSLTVSTNAFNMDAIGGDYDITITCNGSWRINVDNSAWCSVDKPSGTANTSGEKIKVTCKANTTTDERKANITIVAGNDAKVETIAVTQLAGSLPEVTDPQCEIKSSTELSLTATYTSMFDVTEYGFCYGTSANPTQKVKVGDNGGKSGTISTTLTLEDGNTYYIRSYATSAVGTIYSNDVQVEMKGKQPGKNDNISPDA